MSRDTNYLYLFMASLLLLSCGNNNINSGDENIIAEPEQVSEDVLSYSFCPDFSIGPNGNAIAIWEEDNVAGNSIYVNVYSVGAGWGEAVLLEQSISSYVATCPNISMNENGDAIVGWQMEDGTNNRLRMWTKYYTNAGGWEPAKRVDLDYQTSGTAEVLFIESDVAIDELGNAAVIWSDEDDNGRRIWGNYFNVSEGWDTPQAISGYGATQLTISMAGGKVMAGWLEAEVTATVYQQGSGWSEKILFPNGSGAPETPQVAMSKNGSGIIIWVQGEDNSPLEYPPRKIFASHYDGTWHGVIAINPDAPLKVSLNVKIAMDLNGNAIAVWNNVAYPISYLKSSYFDNSTSQWGAVETLSKNPFFVRPDIVLNSSGDGAVAWADYLGIYNGPSSDVLVKRYSKTTGWGISGRAARSYSGSIDGVILKMNAQGDMIIGWTKEDKSTNTWDVWASLIP